MSTEYIKKLEEQNEKLSNKLIETEKNLEVQQNKNPIEYLIDSWIDGFNKRIDKPASDINSLIRYHSIHLTYINSQHDLYSCLFPALFKHYKQVIVYSPAFNMRALIKGIYKDRFLYIGNSCLETALCGLDITCFVSVSLSETEEIITKKLVAQRVKNNPVNCSAPFLYFSTYT